MRYIHQLENWPLFTWDTEALAAVLCAVRFRQGLLAGRLASLSPASATEAEQIMLLLDAQCTRALEEPDFQPSSGRPGKAQIRALKSSGEYAIAREILAGPESLLTASRLDEWHGRIANGQSGWRTAKDAPKQIIYGPLGWEKVQFEAPDGSRLPDEMRKLLAWINFRKLPARKAAEAEPAGKGRKFPGEKAAGPNAEAPLRRTSTLWEDGLIRAGLAHLWLITLHPYHDGSARLARAVTDMLLHRATPQAGVLPGAGPDAICSGKRFYSLNERLLRERADYFAALREAQQGGLNVTRWLDWFLHCLERAMIQSETLLAPTMKKDGWRKRAAMSGLNKRQNLVGETMLGGSPRAVSTSSYARMTGTSQDTALRDIMRMVDLGLMRKTPDGGRSTAYRLKWTASAPVKGQDDDSE